MEEHILYEFDTVYKKSLCMHACMHIMYDQLSETCRSTFTANIYERSDRRISLNKVVLVEIVLVVDYL